MLTRYVTRFGLIFVTAILLAALTLPQLASYAQTTDPTAIVDLIYKDLSAKLGKTILRGGDSTWSFEQTIFPDASLGCPQPGQVYAQANTPGYKFTINYAGTAYDYRTNMNATVLFQCGAAGGAPTTIVATPVPVSPGGAPTNMVPNPLAFVDLQGNVSLIPAGDFNAVPLTGDSTRQPVQPVFFYNTTRAYDQPKWSSDGSKLAFTEIVNSAAYVALSGQQAVQVAAGLSTAFPISWSLDGSKLYFAVPTQEQKDSGVVQQIQAVTVSATGVSAPEFAGSIVISVGCGGGGPMDPADLEYMRETGFGLSNMTLEWTPHGFVHTRSCSGSGLALSAPNGQEYWHVDEVNRARVSPDRTRIAAIKDAGKPGTARTLVVIDAATGAVTPLGTTPDPDQVAWSADGKVIYYSTVTASRNVPGSANSALGRQLFDTLWPLTAQDYTVTLNRVNATGGEPMTIFQGVGRGIGVISPIPDGSGAIFSFIPSTYTMVTLINQNATQNDVMAQAPLPKLIMVKVNTATETLAVQQMGNGRQPSFGTAAFQPRAAANAGNVGGSTGGGVVISGNVAPPALVIGGNAVVITTRGDTLNLRQTPSRNAPVIRILKPGAVVTVISGPQQADGFRWWQVRADDASTGWVVDQVTDNDGTTNTLMPQ